MNKRDKGWEQWHHVMIFDRFIFISIIHSMHKDNSICLECESPHFHRRFLFDQCLQKISNIFLGPKQNKNNRYLNNLSSLSPDFHSWQWINDDNITLYTASMYCLLAPIRLQFIFMHLLASFSPDWINWILAWVVLALTLIISKL